MGYTLGIGEKYKYKEDGDFFYNTKEVRLDNAPAFGEPTDYTNRRWPSYTAWSDFARFFDMNDWFYNKKSGVLKNHPGYVPVTEGMVRYINEKYESVKRRYPNIKASYGTDKDEDKYFCRLEWLKFWLNWAYENCEDPIFYNS